MWTGDGVNFKLDDFDFSKSQCDVWYVWRFYVGFLFQWDFTVNQNETIIIIFLGVYIDQHKCIKLYIKVL